jgi:hypothetical protein
MNREIKESDWKVFRELQPVALERFYQRVLDEIARVATAPGKTAHERYGAVFGLIKRRDREMANAFDAPRRSAALLQLTLIKSNGLLSEAEMSHFSAETREVVESVGENALSD